MMRRFLVACVLMLMVSFAWAESLVLGVESAKVMTSSFSGEPVLRINLTQNSQPGLGEFTRQHRWSIVEITIDGRVVSSARIAEPLTGTGLEINGHPDELQQMATRLAEGKAVLRMSVVEGQ